MGYKVFTKIHPIDRAYAVLGIPQGSSREEVRLRYRHLIRLWHPDHYASDPIGQAEALKRMQEVNAAYRTVSAALAGRSSARPNAKKARRGPPAGRPGTSSFLRGLLSGATTTDVRRVFESASELPLDPKTRWRDPWNHLSGALALVYVVLVTALTWGAAPAFGIWQAIPFPVAALGLVLTCLALVWFGKPLNRLIGFLLLLFFTVILPAFALLLLVR
jgi:DnaJ domain